MLPRPRRLLRKAPPTAALGYRSAVAASVLVAMLAALTQGAVGVLGGSLAMLAVPFGFVVSYKLREEKNILLKVALAAALFVAFGAFLGAVQGAASVDDTRAPLTQLFMWVLVLHSFDVPRRRDLAFSTASSVALMALAGSMAFSTTFGLYLLAYTVAFLASLSMGAVAKARERAAIAIEDVGSVEEVVVTGEEAPPGRARRGSARAVAAMLVLTLLAAFGVFVALPRLPGLQVATLPFELARSSPLSNFAGEVVNPGRTGSAEGGGGGTASQAFTPEAYFGYGERLDLRVRGRLEDELVLRVRSPEPQLWRAQAYDRYDGTGWTSTDEELQQVSQGFDRSMRIREDIDRDRTARHELIQTFYVERELPNLVFGAGRISEVFAPSSTALVDDFGSVRLPFTLEEETIYSVISEVSHATPEDLRFSPPADTTDPRLQRYLQLPDTLSDRFHSLADEITGGQTATVDKVLAVQDWIHRNKRYRIDIPRDPPGQDPVEVFLFSRDEGFCEQIATAMTLLLRSAGVPTRLVTGFGEGERNLFTGYWEVSNADAHAWLEVWYPGFGWIAYDPTFGVPVSDAANTTFMFEPAARAFRGLVPEIQLGGLAEAASGAAVPVGAAAVLLLAGGLVTGSFRRRGHAGPPATTPRERVAASWLRVEDELRKRGCARWPHETVGEFLPRARSHPEVPREAVEQLAEAFTHLRYAAREPTATEASACEELADRVVEALGSSRPPVFSVRS